jgi:small acid-soluble spore protein F (minor alpha/beta-type SASP)
MKGEDSVARRRGVMSGQLKEEIAKELGFYEVVEKEGWGGIRAKDAGNLVKRAVEMAQAQLTNKN